MIVTIYRLVGTVVCGGWFLYLTYLIVHGHNLTYSPLRSGLVTVGAVATMLLGIGAVLHRLRRLEQSVGGAQAVELGRTMERIRREHNHEAVVVPLRDRFSEPLG